MAMIPSRSFARKAFAHWSNSCRIAASSLAAVRAPGIHRSETHASVRIENTNSFFIVDTPFTSGDKADNSLQTATTMPGGCTETNAIIGWRVGRVKPAACNALISNHAGVFQELTRCRELETMRLIRRERSPVLRVVMVPSASLDWVATK